MRIYFFFLIGLIFISCQNKNEDYAVVILEDGVINSEFLQTINPPGKALLSWYLFAYGNECDGGSKKIKCKLLKELKIEDECNPDHLNFLLQWFSHDMLAVYKLNSCPNINYDSVIQNKFSQISLERKGDVISIKYHVEGINSVQEKSWNMNKTGSYLIENNTFSKLKTNEK